MAMKAVVVLCELKAQGGVVTSIVRICETSAMAKDLVTRRAAALKELFAGQVFVDGQPTGLNVSEVLADIGILGVNHRFTETDVSDPSALVQPKMVLM